MAWANLGEAHRPVVMGTHGMVASAHYLASLAGLNLLQQGGNAIDAAVATAAALNVVEPYMSGLGGGGYMIMRLADGTTTTLDYSGKASFQVSLDELDLDSIDTGPKAPVVPGAPAGWLEALSKFGTKTADEVFSPAIGYARDGVPISIRNNWFISQSGNRLGEVAAKTFLDGDKPPAAASIRKQPQLARSLEMLAAEGSSVFYDGVLGNETIECLSLAGGFMSHEDLRSYSVSWREPLAATYRDYHLATISPPATAFQVPTTLKLLEGFDLRSNGQNSPDAIHIMAEAMKLAVVDRICWAGDADAPFDGLFSTDYAEQRRELINLAMAQPVEGERYTRPLPEGAVRPGSPEDFQRENTTHFDVVDEAGNCVSVTQSLGSAFGSGVMAGDTGILLNNFSHFYDLDPESPNAIGPGVPRMTSMAPTIISIEDQPFLLIGTPGAFGILETTVQMISNVIDHEFSIQAAIEAPRFRTYAGRELAIEGRVPAEVLAELGKRGHELRILDPWSPVVGGGHGIMIDPETGVLQGGADPRRDGFALGF